MQNRGSALCFTFMIVFVLLSAEQTSAQLLRTALPTAKGSKLNSNNTARTKALPAKKLPFWDDFSFADGIFPKDTLWENSKSVWITRGIGANTPSIQAATFDGLNQNGNPYSTEILANGYRDTLTSRAIRLDLVTTDLLKGRTYLSFYYQWQGNGEAPENTDYLQLDFKDSAGAWVEQFRIYPRASHDRMVFYDTIYPVMGNEFFHEDFQFRFLSYGRNSGPYDTWNVDYVYLNTDRTPSRRTHPDRAIASELSSLFGEYRSIPLKHFRTHGAFDSVRIDLMNFKNVVRPALFDAVKFSIVGFFTNYFSNNTKSDPDSIVLKTDPSLLLDFNTRRRVAIAAYPDTTLQEQFDDDAVAIDIRLKAVLDSGDMPDGINLGDDSKDEEYQDNTDRRVNDTISSYHHLHDFYAYDDDVAEHAVYLARPNNIAVVEYNLITGAPDLLTAIDIYFPDYGITSTQTLDFVVYFPNGSNSQPEEEPVITLAGRTPVKDTITGFHRVAMEPLLVPKKFYIGWVAPALGRPKVGVDVSNDAGDKIFTRINGVWLNNDDGHRSSIMIRPVFGKDEDPITGIDEESRSIMLFPNPNRGEFYVAGKHDQLSIINVTGKPVTFQQEKQGDNTKISFHSTPGLYLLRIKDGNRVRTEKFIVVP